MSILILFNKLYWAC